MSRSHDHIRSLEEMEKSLRLTIDEQSSSLREREKGSETLGSESRLLQQRLTDLQRTYDEQTEQLQDTRNVANRTATRLQRTEREVEIITEKLQTSENSRLQLEQHCNEVTKQLGAATQRSVMEREENRRLIGQKENLEGKIQELKVLVTAIEGSSRQQAQRSTRVSCQLEEAEAAVRSADEVNRRLREQLTNAERTASDLQESLRELDEQRDKLQVSNN